jgi:hypothetical protein
MSFELSDNEDSDCGSMFNNSLQEHKIVCTKTSLTSPLSLQGVTGLKIWNFPTLKKNTPVIACIGSSRDGKSTSLNLYLNYIFKHGEIHKGAFKKGKLNIQGK